MNENLNDPQSPQGDANDPQPRHPEAQNEPSTDATATEQHDAAAASEPKRGRGILKPILVGTGAAFVVLAVAGVGMSIADAVSDGDDDQDGTQPSASAPVQSGAPAPSASSDADDDSSGDDSSGDDSSAAVPSTSTDLVAAIDAAIRAAGGGAATSIDVEGQGWEVDVRLDDGTEVDVRVPVSGDPVVRADDDDRSSDAPLDPARIADISEAAIAAAGGGVVVSIETEDDGQVRFEVEVEVEVAQGGDDVDVELADDLAVVAVDR